MSDQGNNNRSFARPALRILGVLVIAMMCSFSLGLTVYYVSAQSDEQQPDEARAAQILKERRENAFVPEDIQKIAYRDDKSGCEKRAGVFVMMARAYKDGLAPDQAVPVKFMLPLVEEVYDDLRRKGVDRAHIDNLKDYKACVKTAKPYENQDQEYEARLVHNACTELTDVVLDTLSAIERRNSRDTVRRRYEGKDIDMIGTAYEDYDKPHLFIIDQLYDASRFGGYSSAVEQGAMHSIYCFM